MSYSVYQIYSYMLYSSVIVITENTALPHREPESLVEIDPSLTFSRRFHSSRENSIMLYR